VGPPGVVGDEIVIERDLHLVNGLEPRPPAFDAEVLVEKGSVEALDDAVGLRALDPCGAVLDVFELQEQLVRVLVGTPTELSACESAWNKDPVIGVIGIQKGPR